MTDRYLEPLTNLPDRIAVLENQLPRQDPGPLRLVLPVGTLYLITVVGKITTQIPAENAGYTGDEDTIIWHSSAQSLGAGSDRCQVDGIADQVRGGSA